MAVPRLDRRLPDDAPALVQALAREADRHPLARKLIVAPTAGVGRELLRALARARGGWTGFEVTMLPSLAARCAAEWIAKERVRVLDALEEEARLDQALDDAMGLPAHQAHFGALAETIGFRHAARRTLLALRRAGVRAERVAGTPFENTARRALLADALRLHEEGLRSSGLIDSAGVLERATGALDRGARLPAPRILLVPGLDLRGRAGRFVRALQARGAAVLPTDPVIGLEAPAGVLRSPAPDPVRSRLSLLHAPDSAADDGTAALASPAVHLFHAAGVHEELREVLRRVVRSGHRWDAVEIATPDPALYGPALHSLCERLEIDTTFAVGLPFARTRPGRAIDAWFRWVNEDYPSAILRRLLESGDLRAPERTAADSPALAGTLRELRIGWGRARYRRVLEAALERARADRGGPEVREQRVRELESVQKLLYALLDAAPGPGGPVSPAAVAHGLVTFLSHLSAEHETDQSSVDRLIGALERVRATLLRPTSFATAIATVREKVAARVPAPRAEGRAPWISEGGALHLCDLAHAGLSGRPHLFVVGMDTDRFPGGGSQDPFLLDDERTRLSPELALSGDSIHEREFEFASLLARCRGTVTVSYPVWDASEARTLEPAAVLLSLFRFREGRATLGYGDLVTALGRPASRIPRGQTPLDDDDVWLGALAAGPIDGQFLDGRARLRARYPALDRGLGAREAPERPEPTPQVGILSGAGVALERLDPLRPDGPVLSASRLEMLGACPLRYFYAHALGVRPPRDPDLDPETWLGHPERGSLLHAVFRSAVEAARAEGIGFDTDDFRAHTLAALGVEVDKWKARLPPPGDAAVHREVEALRADVHSFCAQLAAEALTPDQVLATELALGYDEPIALALPGGHTVRIRGKIDRVDRLASGVRIVDYKTGIPWGHDTDAGVYHGGRRSQHVVYLRALEASGLLDEAKAGPVTRVSYHFPTHRGENWAADYSAAELERGLELVAALAALPGSGRFPATDDVGDCKLCDYRTVCRHLPEIHGVRKASTPRVAWTKARKDDGDPVVAELARVRAVEGKGKP